MKKLIIILAAILGFNFAAYSQDNKKDDNMKTLVVYFSATGTTKAAAQRLAKEFNADLKKAYPQYTWGESRLMNNVK